MEINWLKVPQWESYPGLLHGFIGRRGGASAGAYAELNLSLRVGDDAQSVKKNVCDMKQAVGMHDGRLVTMTQVHGDRVVEVSGQVPKDIGEADGMVTRERDAFLGVLTADCVPILLLAPRRRVVAAVHAGWRGTLAGIAAKAVELLRRDHGVVPSEVEAALGPSIGSCCYEIRADVSGPLQAAWGGAAEKSMAARDGKWFVDLRRLNRDILLQAGLDAAKIFIIGPCTSCAQADYFSYRRERAETGRQISFIGWLPAPL